MHSDDRKGHLSTRQPARTQTRGGGRRPGVIVVVLFAVMVLVGFGTAQGAAQQPTVSAVWPRMGPPAGGTPLTVVGSGFSAGSASVTVDGLAANNVTVVSDGVLTAKSPSLPSGAAPSGAVVVTTTAGTSASTSSLATYAYSGGPALAVPSYFYALTADWAALDGPPPTADLAVINPASGPGKAPDPNYAQQVAASQAAGVDVIGYVHTSFGTRSLSTVESEITDYEQWYGVNGIFVDEAATDCQTEASYYAPLYAFIHAQPGLDLTVLNPGTATHSCYMAASDVLITFEGTPTALAAGASVVLGYDPSRFWGVVYGANTSALPSALATLASDGFGEVYVTNLGLPNPYGALPSYWSQEVADAAGTAPAPPPVQAAAAITTQPASQTVAAGQNVTFSAAASGTPTPSVQWQVSTNGGAWSPIAGATNTTLTLTGVSTAMSGNQYQAVFSNGVGSPATTNAAVLTVNPAAVVPTITSASALTTPHGASFSFTVTATGTPLPTITESGRLPGGVTFTTRSAGSATLSGNSSTRRGTYTFTITAGSGSSRATQHFTLTLS